MNIPKEEVVKLYVIGGKSTKEISELAGVSQRHVNYVLDEKGVSKRGNRRTNGYKVDEDFFKTWSADMAYVLGFVLTDGCVSGNSFSISQKYPEILERIGSAMKSNYPIRKTRNLHTLTICRKEMVEDLAVLGIGEKKSLTVDFPDVPAVYLPHFIRGVIDGDGWVQDRGYVMNVTSGSILFAVKLHEVFNAYGLNGRIQKQSGAYRVTVSGKEDVARMAELLYENPGDLYLARKRTRFEIHTKKDAS
jgi:DNA-binding transcriptional regulator WhiA